jgi:hypothetical protein
MTNPPPSNRRLTPFRPSLETLEDRCVPACLISENAGILLILGDNNVNHIDLEDAGGGGAGNVVVACDGQVIKNAGVITGIRVRARGGNDVVTYTQTKSLSSGQSRNVVIDMGTDHDVVTVALNNGLSANSHLNLVVRGGTGQSQINVTGAGVIAGNAGLTMNLSAGGDANRIRGSEAANIASGGILGINVHAGGNLNVLTAAQRGQASGMVNVKARAGGRFDRINALLTPAPGSTGLITARVTGGPGNDAIRFIARKITVFDTVGFDAVLNGGAGLNFCTRTANVSAVNCSIDHVVT